MSARAPVRPKKSEQSSAAHDANWYEEVRRRAYDLYLQRSGRDGSEINDWLQAESEMSAVAESRDRNQE